MMNNEQIHKPTALPTNTHTHAVDESKLNVFVRVTQRVVMSTDQVPANTVEQKVK